MDAEAFAARHPQLFHACEAGAWPSIRRLGLLSTTALLDRFEVAGEQRERIESHRRPDAVSIAHPRHGDARIRDNRPLRESVLAHCLVDMSPREWHETLNRKVFFWVEAGRLERLLGARAHRGRAHDVLVVDTRRLLERHRDRVTLTAINTGAALFPSAPARGSFTFAALRDVDPDEIVVELAVEYSVPDIEQLVTAVRRSPPKAS